MTVFIYPAIIGFCLYLIGLVVGFALGRTLTKTIIYEIEVE